MILNLWDCVCDACDPHGRYHNISGQGKWSPPPKRSGPRWGLLLLVLIIGIAFTLYMRGLA